MPRVGGEFDLPDGRLGRFTLRFVFLDVLNEEVPQVLEDLARNVLPVYRAAAERARAAGLHDRYWLSEPGLRRAPEMRRKWEARRAEFGPEPLTSRKIDAFGALGALRAALLGWATRYDLSDADGKRNRWVLESALRTLRVWNRDRPTPSRGWIMPGVGYSHALPPEARRIGDTPDSPEVELFVEPRRHAEARLMALGLPRSKARAALAELETLYEAAGFKRTPWLQTRDNDPVRFFRWLARYVCARVTQTAMAGDDWDRKQAINRNLRELARLIGFDRPERRGRPRRSR